MWHIRPPEQLDHLADVDTSTTAPTDGQALVFDDGSGLWVPGDGGGGGSVAVDDGGTEVTAVASRLNFGDNLTVTDDGGGAVTIDASGGGGGGGGAGTFCDLFGDDVETTIDVVHGLGTSCVQVGVVEVASGDALVHGTDYTWLILDDDTVRLVFSSAPDTDDARVVVLASGGSGSGAFAGTAVRRTSDQSGIAHDTPTALIWQAADFDVGGITDIGGANPSRLTVTAGKWAASATVDWQPTLGDQTILRTSIAVNGTILRQQAERTSGSGGNQGPSVHDVLDLADGDYVQFMASQLSNSSQTVRADVSGVTATFASLVKVG